MKVDLPWHTALIEGVSSGFTFTFLDKNNRGLHTPAQCKDYFQDLFWSEYNNKPCKVYGFTWTPGRLDKNAKTYHMALQEKGTDLEAIAPQLLGFLHHFDGAQDFMFSGVHHTDSPDTIVLEFDARWTHSAPMVSAFTTLVRLGFTYPGGDIREYLTWLQANAKPADWRNKTAAVHRRCLPDAHRFATIKPRIMALLNGKFPRLPYTALSTANTAHNTGIVGWAAFPQARR